MKITKQNPITLDNCCNAIYDENELIKAIMWYSDKPTYSKKKVSLHGKYPCVSIYEKKIHIHRLLMMYWLNSEIPQGFFVHHINGDKLNALKENLTLVSVSEHQSYHNTGKQISAEQRQKIREKNRERKGVRRKPKKSNITPKMVYSMRISGMSFNKISKELGIDWGCVKQRYDNFIHDNPELLRGAD